MTGVHSTRCTQSGGANSISTRMRRADDDGAEDQHDEDRRPVARILRREIEAAAAQRGATVRSPS